ncbi:hypothetical protein CRENBAI_021041 [Crenichthys baileyi]|uniref:Uncharacterized protein n=1 Tax=Crenichthys baileyi TaxID=28760 RepID=A0AAV9SIL1_9TELE
MMGSTVLKESDMDPELVKAFRDLSEAFRVQLSSIQKYFINPKAKLSVLVAHIMHVSSRERSWLKIRLSLKMFKGLHLYSVYQVPRDPKGLSTTTSHPPIHPLTDSGELQCSHSCPGPD